MAANQGTENLKQLLSMFPGVDSEICEAVLQTNNGHLEASINTLLSITDPNYQPPPDEPTITTNPTAQTTERPQSQTSLPTTRTTTTPSLPQRKPSPLDKKPTVIESRVFVTKEEQIRRDEELAKRLAAEDQIEYVETVQQQQQQQQRRRQQQQKEEEDQSSPFPDFSEEFPVIKEKIVQAADTTKKKVKEWYDKFKQQSATLRNEYNSSYDNDYNNNYNHNQNLRHSNLPYDESDNPLLDEEDFTKSLESNSNRHKDPVNFTSSGDSKSEKIDNDGNIHKDSSGGNNNYNEKFNNNNNLRSSPLRSQQPVYGSYEIDLNNKKDSYSPFNINEKSNDLITTTSSSTINNNNTNTDGIGVQKNNQLKSTTEIPPYSIFVKDDDDDDDEKKDEKEKQKDEISEKNLDTVFNEKLNITTATKPTSTTTNVTSSSSSSSSLSNSANNAASNSNDIITSSNVGSKNESNEDKSS